MSNFNEFRIEQPSLVQALDKYREMEKVLEEEYDSLQDVIIQSSNEWQGAASEALISEMEYFLNEGDYNTAYENVKTMRMCMEDTLEQVNALLARSEEFPKQLQSSTYIEPMRPAMGDDTVRNGGVLYLDYGKANIVPDLCDQVCEAAEYLGNVLKQYMEDCEGIMDGIPTYISRVDEAVRKIKRIENYKLSFQKYVQGVMALENDVAVRLAGMKTVQRKHDNDYSVDSSVMCKGETVRNVEYEFLDFINGTSIYYNEETLLSSLEQMYNDGYFTSEDYQKLKDLVSLYTHLPGPDAAIIRSQIIDIYHNSEKEYELLQEYVSEDVLEQLGWTNMDAVKANFGENFVEELRIAMMKAGIVSEASIKVFLITMTHETKKGLSPLEDGSESYFATLSYTQNTRGAGLMHVSKDTQCDFLIYICKITDDEEMKSEIQHLIDGYTYNANGQYDNINVTSEGLTASEFIAKYYSVESAIWFWTLNYEKIKVNGESASLNDFCEYYQEIENQDYLLLATQMAVNGSTGWGPTKREYICAYPENVTCNDEHSQYFYEGEKLPMPNGWGDRFENMGKVGEW